MSYEIALHRYVRGFQAVRLRPVARCGAAALLVDRVTNRGFSRMVSTVYYIQYARRDTGTDSAPGPIDIMTGRIKPRHEVFVLVVPRSLASKSYDGAVAEGLVLRRS